MKKATIKSRILKLLGDAPATSPEVGALLFPRMPMREAMRRASGNLCNLRTRGILKVVGHVPRDGKTGSRLMTNLYALVPPRLRAVKGIDKLKSQNAHSPHGPGREHSSATGKGNA